MKQLIKPLAISAIALALTACSQEKFPANDTELKTDKDKQAYALGSSVGGFIARNLDRQEEADYMLERDIVIAGFVDAVKGDPQLGEEEAEKILNAMREEVMEHRQNVLGKKAAEEGKAYLAENAKKEGVQSTDSGLQYEVLEEGDGVSPSETDMVEVHYEGTLVDGEVFDSSYERGEPTSFPLNRVIPGWTEGLQLMKEGAKYRFVIPSELAYGDRELGDGQIPPNSTLIFTVELLNVQKDELDTE
ncbi:FKBP-type peptidyl-prolyl cis-trans isomerase [Idiomarina sp. PL1-037]|uniref:FKBP-type peptidyl-prolyl cis-trans isomerase n=1 Tax=Idiomarina TaxID=135575 RepID=UPI00294B98CC|nr:MULTISPECIES: FKBP-type peptidyl-prolyl cis-trans isomerase [unclassified Idiomarina]MDV6327624.1 FKBP-type peptidyl-prolyl cis-trans isomerase [Idiomarina sp. Sol25]WQC52722.1 FKBP-type peptidyl-prolyl cis-trans isomerase [Idiomarina sp. PL1-037]